MNDNDIRWKQRFQNFDKAIELLSSAMDENLSMLEKEGLIQRFEYTYELAWKTLKDYLEYSSSINLIEVTARNVFKEAFAAGIIKDELVFIDMMLSRNLLSHCYDFSKFNEIILALKSRYFKALSDLHEFFLERIV